MHDVFKMTVSEDGENMPHGDLWHAGGSDGYAPTLLCTGEVFDEHGTLDAEGFAKCISKTVKRGGITCPSCMNQIKSIKAIKL